MHHSLRGGGSANGSFYHAVANHAVEHNGGVARSQGNMENMIDEMLESNVQKVYFNIAGAL